jgi:hypothetical protein
VAVPADPLDGRLADTRRAAFAKASAPKPR